MRLGVHCLVELVYANAADRLSECAVQSEPGIVVRKVEIVARPDQVDGVVEALPGATCVPSTDDVEVSGAVAHDDARDGPPVAVGASDNAFDALGRHAHTRSPLLSRWAATRARASAALDP